MAGCTQANGRDMTDAAPITTSGKTCMHWEWGQHRYPYEDVSSHNYCRNPLTASPASAVGPFKPSASAPWCYTGFKADGDLEWDWCVCTSDGRPNQTPSTQVDATSLSSAQLAIVGCVAGAVCVIGLALVVILRRRRRHSLLQLATNGAPTSVGLDNADIVTQPPADSSTAAENDQPMQHGA